MGDDQCGPPPHRLLQSRLDAALGFAVQGGGRLVQDQDRRILEQRPGDGHPLPLAAGQHQAILSHRRVQAFRQLLNEVVRMGAADGLADGLRVRIGQGAVGDVGAKAVVEQGHLLRHEGDLATQAGQAIVLHRNAIDPHFAAPRLVEAGNQAGQGRFAAPGAAHQGQGLARFQGQADAVQHRAGAGFVGEMNIAQLDAPLHPMHFQGAFVPLRLGIELAEDVLRRSQPGLQAGVQLGEPADGPRQHAGQGQKAHQAGGGQALAKKRARQQGDERRNRRHHQNLHRLRAGRLDHHHFQILPAVVLARPAEPLPLPALAPEDAHHPVAGHGLGSDLAEIAHRILNAPGDAPEAAAGNCNHQGHQRNCDGEHQAEHPAEIQHAAQIDRHLAAILNDGFQGIRGGVPQLGDIEAHPRNQAALGHGIEEGAGQVQQLLEQLHPQVVDDREGNMVEQGFPGQFAQAPRQRGDQHRQGDEHQGLGRLLLPAIDQLAEQPHEIDLGAAGQQKGRPGGEEERPIGPHIAEQPLVGGPAVGRHA